MNSLFHHSTRLLPIVTAVGLFNLTAEVANAEPIVRVDFGADPNTRIPIMEAGFLPAFYEFTSDSVNLANESLSISDPSIPSGVLQLTLGTNLNFAETGSMNMRSRSVPSDSGAFTFNEFLRDRVVSTAGDGLYLRLTGLQPNTAFQIQVWGYDGNRTNDGTFQLLDRTGGLNLSLGGFSYTAGDRPTSNNDFSVLATVTADANGTIILQSKSNIDGTGIMNGFVLSVPEPATAVTLLGGLGVLVGASRFRRSR